MSRRPDINAALAPGEALLWQGAPKPGRPTPARANLIAALLYALTIGLAGAAWYVEVFRLSGPGTHLAAYGLVGSAAFATYMGLRISVLDRRRARARDARTAHAITDRRALTLSGPYKAELVLGPGLRAELAGGTLTLTGPDGRLRFERLADADAARAILLNQIGEA